MQNYPDANARLLVGTDYSVTIFSFFFFSKKPHPYYYFSAECGHFFHLRLSVFVVFWQRSTTSCAREHQRPRCPNQTLLFCCADRPSVYLSVWTYHLCVAEQHCQATRLQFAASFSCRQTRGITSRTQIIFCGKHNTLPFYAHFPWLKWLKPITGPSLFFSISWNWHSYLSHKPFISPLALLHSDVICAFLHQGD